MASVRRSVLWLAPLTSIAMGLSCAREADVARLPPGPTSRAPADAAAPSHPLVRIVRDDNFADERASSSYDLGQDGSFTIEHVMSNGGGDSTVTACAGHIEAAEAAEWVARVRSEATLASPPRGPSREEAMERRIQYRYEVGYAPDPRRLSYAPHERWARELEALLERLGRSARCRTFTRTG